MKQLTLLALLLVCLAPGCADDDDDTLFNRIALIGRADGWRLGEVVSDMDQVVNGAIDALTEEELADDPRDRDELRLQYAPIIRTATQVNDCDRDDVLFFVENGVLRIIQGDVPCGSGGDPNPLARFNNRTYTTDAQATEILIRATSGELLGTYDIEMLNDDLFAFEREVTVADSVFTDVRYSIRYELVPN